MQAFRLIHEPTKGGSLPPPLEPPASLSLFAKAGPLSVGGDETIVWKGGRLTRLWSGVRSVRPPS